MLLYTKIFWIGLLKNILRILFNSWMTLFSETIAYTYVKTSRRSYPTHCVSTNCPVYLLLYSDGYGYIRVWALFIMTANAAPITGKIIFTMQLTISDSSSLTSPKIWSLLKFANPLFPFIKFVCLYSIVLICLSSPYFPLHIWQYP